MAKQVVASIQKIYNLPPEERQAYFPRKHIETSWEGWYIRTFWKYDCPFCRRKGFTEKGFRSHLINAHGFGYAGAYYLIKDAIPVE
jgi:hypothetical protein